MEMNSETPNAQEPLSALEVPPQVGVPLLDPSVSVQSVLGASRGISEGWSPQRLDELVKQSKTVLLPKVEGSTIRLSKFSKKQLSRRVKVRPGTKRHGKLLRTVKSRPKRHYKSEMKAQREWQRKYHRSARRKFWELRKKKGPDQWLVTEDEWNDIWELLGTWRFTVLRYDDSAPYTKYNLYIFDKSGKLYEGAEEQLRDMGYIT
jgi:hypothetical protein